MFCNSKIRLIANVVELTLLMSFVVLTSSVVSAQKVRYNFMPGTDFSKYHTYKWVDTPSNVHPNQIVAQEIRDAVNNTLAAKGLNRLPVTKPTSILATSARSTSGNGTLGEWAADPAGAEWVAESSTITNGMLAVDFYDPTSKQLVWRGTAAQTLNPSGNRQKDMEKLNKAVAKLLKHFPPQSK